MGSDDGAVVNFRDTYYGKKRLSPEQAQENISRKEFAKLLEKHGWVTTDVVPDLGEDLLVRVYDNGVFTGISCYVQLKSVQHIEALRLKSGDVSYAFEVDDLKHWEGHAVPVLLVVWEIDTERGCYFWIKDAASQLSSRNPSWRMQKWVNVHFPNSHKFDEPALKKLRLELADYYHEIISKGKEFTVHAEFRFPIKGDGSEKLPEFQRFWDAGDSIELDSRFISKFELPDWWKRLYGHIEITELKIVPHENAESTQFQIRFHSKRSETVVLSNVELRMEKGGEKEATFTNKHQNVYYIIRLVINNETNRYHLSITFQFRSIDVYEVRDALTIMQFMSEGCRIIVRNVEIKEEFAVLVPEHSSTAPPSHIIDFIDKLCRIQDEMAMTFTLQEEGVFSSEDEDIVDQFIAIISTGRFEYSSSLLIQVAKPGIEILVAILEQQNPLHISAIKDEVSITLLGKEVLLGSATIYIEGLWEEAVPEVRSWLKTANNEDIYPVNIPRANITEVYERWAKDYPNKTPGYQSKTI